VRGIDEEDRALAPLRLLRPGQQLHVHEVRRLAVVGLRRDRADLPPAQPNFFW
jgi:hypothetical protein